MPRKKATPQNDEPSTVPWVAHKLTRAQYEFAEAYIEHGFNGTVAYVQAHPGTAPDVAAVCAHREVRKPNVARYLALRTQAQWQALQLTADEALGRLALIARFDVRDLFDDEGNVLPPRRWPDSIRSCVKGVSVGPQGTKLLFESPTLALRTLLEASNRLKPESKFDLLASALRGDIERRQLPPRPALVIDAPAVRVVDVAKAEPGGDR